MIKGVIFDMDGVLVDNREAHLDAYEEFAKRYGKKADRQKQLSMFGMSSADILPKLLGDEFVKERGVEALGVEYEEIYRDIYKETMEPTPGLIEFIDEARAKGLKCAVGSSGPMVNIEFVLKGCGIEDKFDAIANSEMVENAKPEPDIFLLAAEKMGVKPENCLVIEDAFTGIKAARAAGMKVIAMATTHSKEELKDTDNDLLVDDFRDLSYDIISKL